MNSFVPISLTKSQHSHTKIGPSILNADLSQILKESERLLAAGADFLHLDVMDGHFVPNLTFGHPVVKCLKSKLPTTYFDMHMMVQHPKKWVKPMKDAGADQYTFHIEATESTDDAFQLCRMIKEAGMKVGIGLKPGTPVSGVVEYFEIADMILIMTVEPGFGGQAFMPDMLSKVKFIAENCPGMNIEVDGGVGPSNVQACREAGANMIVSGTAVVCAENPAEVMETMRKSANVGVGLLTKRDGCLSQAYKPLLTEINY